MRHEPRSTCVLELGGGARSHETFADTNVTPCGSSVSQCHAIDGHRPPRVPARTAAPVLAGRISMRATTDGPTTERFAAIRVAQRLCPVGHYCPPKPPPHETEPAGETAVCPRGRYGDAEGLVDAACSGPCASGYTCQAGATTPREALVQSALGLGEPLDRPR